jgi:hypothetical protein
MSRYLDWTALKDNKQKDKPLFILLNINHKDKNYLKKGMKIKVRGYEVRGDEGGTWTSYRALEILGSSSPEENIRNYLQNYIESPGFGGTIFCAYELFGNETKSNKDYVYLWAVCMEYYVKDGTLLKGAGVSMPLALISVRSHLGNRIVGHQTPVDGEGYAESIRRIFPRKYHKVIFTEAEEYNRRAESLLKNTERQARTHFHKEI